MAFIKQLGNESSVVQVYLPKMAGNGMCDCGLLDCIGCFYPCHKCKSNKCGHVCRTGRFWTYFDWTPEDGRKRKRKNYIEEEELKVDNPSKQAFSVDRKRNKYGALMKLKQKREEEALAEQARVEKAQAEKAKAKAEKAKAKAEKAKAKAEKAKAEKAEKAKAEKAKAEKVKAEKAKAEKAKAEKAQAEKQLQKAQAQKQLQQPKKRENVKIKERDAVPSKKIKIDGSSVKINEPIVISDDDDVIFVDIGTASRKSVLLKSKNLTVSKKDVGTKNKVKLSGEYSKTIIPIIEISDDDCVEINPKTVINKIKRYNKKKDKKPTESVGEEKVLNKKANKDLSDVVKVKENVVNKVVRKRERKILPIRMPLSDEVIVIEDDEDVVLTENKDKRSGNVSIESIAMVDNYNMQTNAIKAAPRVRVQLNARNKVSNVTPVKENVLSSKIKIIPTKLPMTVSNEIIVIEDDEDVVVNKNIKIKEIPVKQIRKVNIEPIKIVDNVNISTNTFKSASNGKVLFAASNDLSNVSKVKENALNRNVRIQDKIIQTKIPMVVANKIVQMNKKENVNCKIVQIKPTDGGSMQTKGGAVLKRNIEIEENSPVSDKRVKLTTTNTLVLEKNDVVPIRNIKLVPMITVKKINMPKFADLSTTNIVVEKKDAVSEKILRLSIKPTNTLENKNNNFVPIRHIKLEPMKTMGKKNNPNNVTTTNIVVEEKKDAVSEKSLSIKPTNTLENKDNDFVSNKKITLEPKETITKKNIANNVTNVSTTNIVVKEKDAVSEKGLSIKPTNTLGNKNNDYVTITNIKLEPKKTVRKENIPNNVTDESTKNVVVKEKDAVSEKGLSIKPTSTLKNKKNDLIPIENIKLKPKESLRKKNIPDNVTDVSTTNIVVKEKDAVSEKSLSIKPSNTLENKKNNIVPIKNIKLEPKETVRKKNIPDNVTDVSTTNIVVKEKDAVSEKSLSIKPTNALENKTNDFVPITNIKLESMETVRKKNIPNYVKCDSTTNIVVKEKGAVSKRSLSIKPTSTLKNNNNDLILIQNIKLEPEETVRKKNIPNNVTDVSTTNIVVEEKDAVSQKGLSIKPSNTLENKKNDFVPIKIIKQEPMDTVRKKIIRNNVTDVSTTNIVVEGQIAVSEKSLSIKSTNTIENKKNDLIPIKNIKLEPKETSRMINIRNNITDVSTTNIVVEEKVAVSEKSLSIKPTNTLENKKNDLIPIKNIKLENKETVRNNNVTYESTKTIIVKEQYAVSEKSLSIKPTNTWKNNNNDLIPIQNIKLEPKETLRKKIIRNNVTDESTKNIVVKEKDAVSEKGLSIKPISTLKNNNNDLILIQNIKLEPEETVRKKNIPNKVTDESTKNIVDKEKNAVSEKGLSIKPTSTLKNNNNDLIFIQNIKLEPEETVRKKNIPNKVTDESTKNIVVKEKDAVSEKSLSIKPTNTLGNKKNDFVPIKNIKLEPKETVRKKNIPNNVTDESTKNIVVKEKDAVSEKGLSIKPTSTLKNNNNDLILIQNIKLEPEETVRKKNIPNNVTDESTKNIVVKEKDAVSEKRLSIKPTSTLKNNNNDLILIQNIKLEPKETVRKKNIPNNVTDESTKNIVVKGKDAVAEKGLSIKPTSTLKNNNNDLILIQNIKLEPEETVRKKNIPNNVTDESTKNIVVKEKNAVSEKGLSIKPISTLKNNNNDLILIQNIKLEPEETVRKKNIPNNVTDESTKNIVDKEKNAVSEKRLSIKPTSTLKNNNNDLILIQNIKLEPKETLRKKNIQNNVTDKSTKNIVVEGQDAVSEKSLSIIPTNTWKNNNNDLIPIHNIKLEPKETLRKKNIQNNVTDKSTKNIVVEGQDAVSEKSLSIKPTNTLKKNNNDFVPIQNIKQERIISVKNEHIQKNITIESISNIKLEPIYNMDDNNIQNNVLDCVSATNSGVHDNEFAPIINVKHEPTNIMESENIQNNVSDVSNLNEGMKNIFFVPTSNIKIEPTDMVKDNDCVPIEIVKDEPFDIMEEDCCQNIPYDLSDFEINEFDPNKAVTHTPIDNIDMLDNEDNPNSVSNVSNTKQGVENNALVPINNIIMEPIDKVNDNNSVPIENVKIEPIDVMVEINMQNTTDDLSNSDSDIEIIEPNTIVNGKPLDIIIVPDDDDDQNTVSDISNSNIEIENNVLVSFKNIKIEPKDTIKDSNSVPIENVNVEPIDIMGDDNNKNTTDDLSNPSSDVEKIEFDPNKAVTCKSIDIIEILDDEVNVSDGSTLNGGIEKNALVPIKNEPINIIEVDNQNPTDDLSNSDSDIEIIEPNTIVNGKPLDIIIVPDDDQNTVSDVSNSNIEIENNVLVSFKNIKIEPKDTIKDSNIVPIENVKVEPINIMEDDNIQNTADDLSNSDSDIEIIEFDPNKDVTCKPIDIIEILDDEDNEDNVLDGSTLNGGIEKNVLVPIKNEPINIMEVDNQNATDDLSNSDSDIEIIEPNTIVNGKPLDIIIVPDDDDDQNTVSDVSNSNIEIENNVLVSFKNIKIEPKDTIKDSNSVPIENVNVEPINIMEVDNIQNAIDDVSNSDSDIEIIEFDPNTAVNGKPLDIIIVPDEDDDQNNVTDVSNSNVEMEKDLFVPNKIIKIEPMDAVKGAIIQNNLADFVSHTNSEIKDNNCVPIENVNVEPNDIMEEDNIQNTTKDLSNPDSDIEIIEYDPKNVVNRKAIEIIEILDDEDEQNSVTDISNSNIETEKNVLVPIKNIKIEPIEKDVTDLSNSKKEMDENDFVHMNNVTIEPINIEEVEHLEYENTDDKEIKETENDSILPIGINADAMQIESKVEVKNTTVQIDAKDIVEAENVRIKLYDIEEVDIMQTKPIDEQTDKTFCNLEAENVSILPVDFEETDAMQIESKEDMEDKLTM